MKASVRITHLPTWSRLRVATKQSAQIGAGGDFFEVLQHRDGRVSAVIADVCGSGPAAALIVSLVRPALQHHLGHGDGPGDVLAGVNEWLCARLEDHTFVTAVAVRIDAGSGHVEVASAGHLGPFIRRRGGQAEALDLSPGVPLGMLPEQAYPELSFDLDPNDAVVLVTDGITDPLGSHADLLGERGLLRRLASSPDGTADICHALLGDDAPARDDATVLVLQLPPRAPAAVEEAA